MKQLLEVDFAKHLGKLEKAIKDNDMILAEITSIEVGIFMPGTEDEEPDELTRNGAIGVPRGRHYEICARILVPFPLKEVDDE